VSDPVAHAPSADYGVGDSTGVQGDIGSLWITNLPNDLGSLNGRNADSVEERHGSTNPLPLVTKLVHERDDDSSDEPIDRAAKRMRQILGIDPHSESEDEESESDEPILVTLNGEQFMVLPGDDDSIENVDLMDYTDINHDMHATNGNMEKDNRNDRSTKMAWKDKSKIAAVKTPYKSTNRNKANTAAVAASVHDANSNLLGSRDAAREKVRMDRDESVSSSNPPVGKTGSPTPKKEKAPISHSSRQMAPGFRIKWSRQGDHSFSLTPLCCTFFLCVIAYLLSLPLFTYSRVDHVLVTEYDREPITNIEHYYYKTLDYYKYPRNATDDLFVIRRCTTFGGIERTFGDFEVYTNALEDGHTVNEFVYVRADNGERTSVCPDRKTCVVDVELSCAHMHHRNSGGFCAFGMVHDEAIGRSVGDSKTTKNVSALYGICNYAYQHKGIFDQREIPRYVAKEVHVVYSMPFAVIIIVPLFGLLLFLRKFKYVGRDDYTHFVYRLVKLDEFCPVDPDTDDRADVIASADLKHPDSVMAKCRLFARCEGQVTLFGFRVAGFCSPSYRIDQKIISLELFTQIATAKNLSVMEEASVVKGNIAHSANNFSTVNIDRHCSLRNENSSTVVQNTIEAAYYLYLSYLTNSAETSFLFTPVGVKRISMDTAMAKSPSLTLGLLSIMSEGQKYVPMIPVVVQLYRFHPGLCFGVLLCLTVVRKIQVQ
jgi:hypothetical protein